jgi:hypothetical protein
MRNTSPIDPALVGKHIVCRCLPILGAGVLIFWLSGGLAPRAWLSFFQTCVHLHALWSERGVAVLLLLFIQFVQALLLGGAWGLLGWMAVQEGSVLYEMFSGTRRTLAPALASSLNSKPLQPQLPQGRSTTSQQQQMLRISQIARPPIQQSRGDIAVPLSPMRDDGISRGMQMLASKDQRLWAYEDEHLKNPFEDWEASPPMQSARQMANPFNDWEAFPPAQSAQPAQRTDRARNNNSEGRQVRLPSHQQEFMGEYPPFNKAGQSISTTQQDDLMDPFFIDEKRLAAFRQKEAAINQPDLADKRPSSVPPPGTGSVHSTEEVEQSSPEHEGGNFSLLLDQMGFLPHQQSGDQQRLDEAQMQQVSLKAMAQNAAEAGAKPYQSLKNAATENAAPAQANPFNVQRDVLEMFQQERSLAAPLSSGSQPAPSSKPAAQLDEPEARKPSAQPDEPRPSGNTSEYVFGNPFDGPLPDIFEHDEDLKRAISEQSKRRPQPAAPGNQSAPNGEGQPSKRRKRRSKAGNLDKE